MRLWKVAVVDGNGRERDTYALAGRGRRRCPK